MRRKFSDLMLWVLLAFAVAAVPIACAGSYDGDDGGAPPKDGPGVERAMTGA